MFIKFFRYITHSERNKTDKKQLTDETRDSCSYSTDRFFLISVETDIQFCEKSKFVNEYWRPRRLLFSINTSAETMSWKLRYCYFVIQRSLLFTQTKYLLILHFLAFIIFDLIFTKLNALRRPLLQTGTFWNYLDKFSGAATERKLSKRVLWVY